MSELKATPGPWNICWTTYNGRPVNFSITASPYGSIRPIVETEWKTDWSEVEGKELEANAHLIAAAPALYEDGECAATTMETVARELGERGLIDLADDLRIQARSMRIALSAARGEEPKP